MKNILRILLALSIYSGLSAQVTSIHTYEAKTILGDTISMNQYYGKKLMIVNTASFCGYTYQYEDLENLYLQYQSNNFEIIGFPCNNFGNQEPHGDSTIQQVCNGYNVTFQMMSKVDIVTGDTAPIYKWLQRADLNGVSNAHVSWNFNKFLIDEAGHWVRHFGSTTLPGDTAITNWILSPSVISGIAKNEKQQLMTLSSGNVFSSKIEIVVNESKSDETLVQLFSLDGRQTSLLFSGSTNKPQLITANIQSFPSGLYILKASDSSSSQVEKIVIRN